MNKVSLRKIESAAQYLEDLLGSEAEILKVLEFTAKPSHKRILKAAIALLQKETPEHLSPPTQMAFEILRLTRSSALTSEEIAAKIGKSSESVRQAIAALKIGGIDFQESGTGKFQPTGRPRTARRRL